MILEYIPDEVPSEMLDKVSSEMPDEIINEMQDEIPNDIKHRDKNRLNEFKETYISGKESLMLMLDLHDFLFIDMISLLYLCMLI